MGLHFTKNRDDGVGVGPVETIERKHDDDYDTLSAVAEDMLAALEKKDLGRLKAALASLVTHIQTLDIEQDKGV